MLVARTVVRNTRADPISLDADQCGRVAGRRPRPDDVRTGGRKTDGVGRRGQGAHPWRPAIPAGSGAVRAAKPQRRLRGPRLQTPRPAPCRWQPAHRSKNAGSCGSTRRMPWRRSGPRTRSSAPKPLRPSRPTGSPSSTSCRRARPKSSGPAGAPASRYPDVLRPRPCPYAPGSRSESRGGLRPDRRERCAPRTSSKPSHRTHGAMPVCVSPSRRRTSGSGR